MLEGNVAKHLKVFKKQERANYFNLTETKVWKENNRERDVLSNYISIKNTDKSCGLKVIS